MALRDTTFLDSKTYGFEWLRLLAELALQEGVLNAGDFKVTAAAAGGQRVDVAAGVALVKGDSGTPGTGLSQGLYAQVNDASIASAVTLNASDGTNPRVDQIILTVNDSSDLGSAGNTPTLSVVTGTPTAGATLDNRSGAGALPSNAIRLADVLVPAGSTAVTAGNVRDRRQWARGAYRIIERSGVTNYSTTSTTFVTIDATNLNPRIECSGAPLRVSLRGTPSVNTNGAAVVFALGLDGGTLSTGTGQFYTHATAGNNQPPGLLLDDFIPAAGSKRIGPQWRVSAAATASLFANGTNGSVRLVIEELIRQDADNT